MFLHRLDPRPPLPRRRPAPASPPWPGLRRNGYISRRPGREEEEDWETLGPTGAPGRPRVGCWRHGRLPDDQLARIEALDLVLAWRLVKPDLNQTHVEEFSCRWRRRERRVAYVGPDKPIQLRARARPGDQPARWPAEGAAIPTGAGARDTARCRACEGGRGHTRAGDVADDGQRPDQRRRRDDQPAGAHGGADYTSRHPTVDVPETTQSISSTRQRARRARSRW